jgi:hypothetical protein
MLQKVEYPLGHANRSRQKLSGMPIDGNLPERKKHRDKQQGTEPHWQFQLY